MRTGFSIVKSPSSPRLGKLHITWCTTVSRDSPDFFRHQFVSVFSGRKSSDRQPRVFVSTGPDELKPPFDLSTVKPSHCMDLQKLNRVDIRKRDQYYVDYHQQLASTGFAKSQGPFSSYSNIPVFYRTDLGAKRRSIKVLSKVRKR